MEVPQPRITARVLLEAYSQGKFLMAHDDGLYWHDPDPRAIFQLNTLKPNKRTQRFIRKMGYGTTVNTAFEKIIRACADRQETWITEEMILAYIDLHDMGYAFSVETWERNSLVGGVYGVSIGNAFFGESMFSIKPNGSKAAFYKLADHLRSEGYTLFDTQYVNDHTRLLGAVEVPKVEFRVMLKQALEV